MKALRILFFALTMVAPIPAAFAADIIARADSAYRASDFEGAVRLYQQAVSEQGTSPELLYNLGNALYRTGHTGDAVVCYERALRLNPRMKEARENLRFIDSRIVDRPGERGTFVGNALDSAANAAGTDLWAWCALVLLFLTVAGVALYVMADAVMLRKVGFFGSGVALLLCIVALFFSFRARSLANDRNTAVVTVPSIILSTAPRIPANPGEEALMLHEGTRVEVLDSVSVKADTVATVWYDVRVDNLRRAWLPASAVTRVRP